jgi:hypothetical protein
MAAGSEPNCEATSDCPVDQMCRAGLCSVPNSAATTLDFRFLPPSSSDFLSQQIDDVQVRTEQNLDFGLERAITVNSGESSNNGDGTPTGGIRYANRLNGPSGTLLFQPARTDQLFGRDARVTDGSFSARITPGRYSLTFVPEDRSELPKTSWPAEDFESNTYLLRTLRAPVDLIEVGGTLSRSITVGVGTDPTDERITGARVYAISTDGLHASTVVTTDEHGEFTLKVEPNSGTYDLFVVPTESTPRVLNITDEEKFEITEDQCIPKSGRASPRCNLAVSLGAYPAEPVAVDLALTPPEGHDDAANFAGTTVVVTGAVAAGTYSRKYEVQFSEQSGRWEADLELFPVAWSVDEMPRYTVEIVPPTRSQFARTTHSLEGALDLDVTQTFEVDMKRQVQGRVLDSEARALSAVKLDFRVAPSGESESHDARVISVTTDNEGGFEVWLEETDYDVSIVPPPGTGQPRVLAEAASTEFAGGGDLVFELPRPAVLVGSVVGARDASGEEFQAVADVTVEAYQSVGGRTIVVGQGRTDASGNFRMAISSEL